MTACAPQAAIVTTQNTAAQAEMPYYTQRAVSPQNTYFKATTPNNIYVVKKGDTLWQISKTHNTTVAALSKLNNFKPTQNIEVGQKIFLPANSSSASYFSNKLICR